MAIIREDQGYIALTVYGPNGVAHNIWNEDNAWSTAEGGILSMPGSKSRAGGMGTEEELGAQATRADVTLTCRQDDYILAWHPWLESRIGKGEAVVGISFFDVEGVIRTDSEGEATYGGKLKQASQGSMDNSNPAQVMYTVIVACHENATYVNPTNASRG